MDIKMEEEGHSGSSGQEIQASKGNNYPPKDAKMKEGERVKKAKTFLVVAPTPPAPKGSKLPEQEFKSKPGLLALCPRCGVGNINISRCNRCNHKLPADVKLIKDEWSGNQGN